jgi:predicted AAA+ superfamily ATPase
MRVIKRLYTASILDAFLQFPAVLILGARQVGKTTILQHVLPDSAVFDLENQSHYERIHADVSFFLNQQETPLIIDEAQLSARLFNELRVKIDKNRQQNGQYLLSGSSSPECFGYLTAND